MMGMGNLPEMYNLVVNTNHELVGEILNTKTEKKRTRLINQAFDLAKNTFGKNSAVTNINMKKVNNDK